VEDLILRLHRGAVMNPNTLRSHCVRPGRPAPNLDDYERLRKEFSWEKARQELDGLPAGGLNIAHEALDRHAAACGDRLAIRFIDGDWQREDYSYALLTALSSRFANVLDHLGVTAGDRVFTLLGRIPQLYVTLFGTLKARAVYCPLGLAWDRESVAARLAIGGARVLVTTLPLYKHKVAPVRDTLPGLQHVLLVDAAGPELPAGTLSYAELMSEADDTWEIPPTDPASPALMHLTGDKTGHPKAVVHAHESVVAHAATGRYALDLHPGDVFWCTADPAWATGICYGALAPLVNGASMIVDLEEFDAERWYRILQEEGVNVWYTAPAAIRRLMRQGNALATSFCFSHLRHIASVGAPLDPEAVIWGHEIFCMPFHDTWWQAETGAIMIANHRGGEVRPGAMGRPMPGIEAAIVRVTPGWKGAESRVDIVDQPGETGELALRTGWPSMFRGYLGDDESYRRRFAGGWYLSGDLAKQDADGWFWFVRGRTEPRP
jgi:acetyl-CoA synthetase